MGFLAMISSVPGFCPAYRLSLTAGLFIVLAMLFSAIQTARAQSAYDSLYRPTVVVDLTVLDRLGPAPTVPDGRFVMRAPARHLSNSIEAKRPLASRSFHRHHVAMHAPRRNLAPSGQDHVERIGNVTIDYSALPAASVRMATTQTAASQQPSSVTRAQGPADSDPRPVTSAVAASPPSPPAPAPTPAPQVAALGESLARINPGGPFPGREPLMSSGAALATTPPAILPGADARSDSDALGFAPGNADLRVDARSVLDGLARQLSARPAERIQLVAYASGGPAIEDAVQARRVSLARGVAVRSYLIQRGVAGNRIDVRALGNRLQSGGSADRVDLVVLDEQTRNP